jgi:uncharacterized protein (DUF362 family)
MVHPVAIIKQENCSYSNNPPFNPPLPYKEEPIKTELDEGNSVYESVRRLFHLLEYDKESYDTQQWNPLGWLIQPGETVFIKPNMIAHKHSHSEEWHHVITHGSIIRAVVDYVFIALKGKGRIIIGDGPQTDSESEKIIERMGLKEIQKLYKEMKDFEIEVIDLRDEQWIEKDGICIDTIKLPGDPRGSISVNLANDSMFAELDERRKYYYGAFYDTQETNEHHNKGRHEYAISKSPIIADVFINIPKLKTHKKCGLTASLKSLVGINANKNWLPHYAFGSPQTGGDQFQKEERKGNIENAIVVYAKKLLLKKNPVIQFVARKSKKYAYRIFGDTQDIVRSGNWYGNDTVWRMCLDLNRILMYANPDGTIRGKGEAKKYFSVVDGIVGMDGDGPVSGTRKEAGILIAGSNPVAVDAVCAKLMGFDFRKIPLISRSFEQHKFALIHGDYEHIKPLSNSEKWNKPLEKWQYDDLLHFKPHFGWIQNIEIEKVQGD